jgi:hypothetical protein
VSYSGKKKEAKKGYNAKVKERKRKDNGKLQVKGSNNCQVEKKID